MALERWEIDSRHSGIRFSARHMVVAKVRGRFARWSSNIFADGNDPGRASVEAAIDATSITTGIAERDTHLMSGDFLDVVGHPEITFRSTRVEKARGGVLRVVGNLTIRGTTREIVLDVKDGGRTKDPWGSERAGFTARATLSRKAFGLTWNRILEPGRILMVGDDIEVEIEAKAVKRTEVPASTRLRPAVTSNDWSAG